MNGGPSPPKTWLEPVSPREADRIDGGIAAVPARKENRISMIVSILAASVLATANHVRQDVAPELDELEPSHGLFSCSRRPEPYEIALGEALIEEKLIRD